MESDARLTKTTLKMTASIISLSKSLDLVVDKNVKELLVTKNAP